MARNYIRYALKNHIYRADAQDLGLTNTIQPHDVIVLSVNKRRKTCKVKTITSLEYQDNNGQWKFINSKLTDVRDGNILPIPKDQIRTHHLSGINHDSKIIKTNKLYFTNTGTKFPRRYKHLIAKK